MSQVPATSPEEPIATHIPDPSIAVMEGSVSFHTIDDLKKEIYIALTEDERKMYESIIDGLLAKCEPEELTFLWSNNLQYLISTLKEVYREFGNTTSPDSANYQNRYMEEPVAVVVLNQLFPMFLSRENAGKTVYTRGLLYWEKKIPVRSLASWFFAHTHQWYLKDCMEGEKTQEYLPDTNDGSSRGSIMQQAWVIAYLRGREKWKFQSSKSGNPEFSYYEVFGEINHKKPGGLSAVRINFTFDTKQNQFIPYYWDTFPDAPELLNDTFEVLQKMYDESPKIRENYPNFFSWMLRLKTGTL